MIPLAIRSSSYSPWSHEKDLALLVYFSLPFLLSLVQYEMPSLQNSLHGDVGSFALYEPRMGMDVAVER